MVNMLNKPIGMVFFNTTRGVYVIYNGVYWSEIKQDILWHNILFEDFENGSMPTKFYIVNDNSNKWVVGDAETYKGNNSLYISNDNGVTSSYTKNQVSHIYFDINLPTIMSKWRLRSFWKALGETGDFGRVYIDNTASYIPVANHLPTTSSTLYRIGNAKYRNQTNWAETSIVLDNTEAGKLVRIIISFKSDGDNNIFSPSLCLDNFFVEYLD